LENKPEGESMPNVLVTGSNRGIGLEWCRQYADAGWRIFATCRHPGMADELHELARSHAQLSVHGLDVTKSESLQALHDELQHESIDLLINNAGVYIEKYLHTETLRYDDWLQTLEVNTLGPMRVTEALLEQVTRSKHKLVVCMTSHMGSIAEIAAPGDYYYRSSKAALNAAMRGYSIALKEQGVGVMLLHPGWVKTRMGGWDAPLTTTESVAGMRRLVDKFRMDFSGRFFRYNGTEIPW
jgi:NAD(P)-dependent dehydrogenase (short-subunit alcohol dehydrogenase family)